MCCVQPLGIELFCECGFSGFETNVMSVAADARDLAEWWLLWSSFLLIMRARIIVPFLIGFTFCGSHCIDRTIDSVKSPDGSMQAELQTRRCGSVEGWAVWVSGKGTARHQVFMGRMPPPTALEDAKGAVTMTWVAPSTLIIRAASWVQPLTAETAHGTVAVKYEVKAMPYPR